MSCSLIVIQYGGTDLLKNMLDSVSNHNDARLIEEVIVVDNGKEMEKKEKEKIRKRNSPGSIKIVGNESRSYASGVNKGANEASEDILIIANNDIEWQSNRTIRPLIELVSHDSDVGVAGPQLINQDGSWQRSSGTFPSVKSAIYSVLFVDSVQKRITAYHHKSKNQHRRNVDYIEGAFLVTSKNLFSRLDGWDERFDFYAEDADYCFRVQKTGKSVVLEPKSQIIHIGGATSSTQALDQYSIQLTESTTQFVELHKDVLQSKLYTILMALASFERYLLYLLVSRFKESDKILRNRQQALARFQGYAQQMKSSSQRWFN